jgi:hypothetical protein
VVVVTIFSPAGHVHVYEPGVLLQVPAPHGFVPEHSLTSVHPVPGATLPLPVKPFGHVHTTLPAAELGSLHVALATHGLGTSAHSFVCGTQAPPDTTALAWHVQVWHEAPHVAHADASAPQASLSPTQAPAALQEPAESHASKPMVHAAFAFAACATH